ncbi:MAG: aminotransferase class III-fold pyridoxal phosphate-dependent enzyme [Thermoanaerobaculia bacterium]|nr:MAG: aminotransferase class III-fold pyridoxal phosphate-dependent enzyme [Thermoanaerobaculia bacterium]MBZ0100989.1 aminotransferase class III-fold pyridoxal phosphate-dependent enzyme [Thermoanaerobaculia bacterium]
MTDPEVQRADIDADQEVDAAARLVARSRKVLANGELAMSARPLLFGETGVYPQFICAAEGCRIRDTTGGEYVDWVVGWGTALLGYGRPEIDAAVRQQLSAAPTLSMPHALEVEVAERIVELVPNAEMVGFGKNGSDAVTAAVRLARAVTERDVVLQFGFHGFHDWFAAGDRGIRGLPSAFGGLVHPFRYNDLAGLEALFARYRGRVAAVVMEPFQCELPRDGFLADVKSLAHRHGALLVFDEMITGFRVARGGAQELTGVLPDLACFGKALSNGMPLSAYVGPRELMRSADSVGVDMGCRGETLSLAAARAALDIHAEEPVAERVAEIGRRVRAGLEEEAHREGVPLRLIGHPARLELEFADHGHLTRGAALGLFVQGCLERGVLTNGLVFPTLAHDEAAIDATLRAAREALRIVRRGAEGRSHTLPPPFGPAGLGFLDAAEVTDGQLRLSGWLLPLASPPDEVELLDARGRAYTAELGVREDVARAHPEIAGAERCAWVVAVPGAPEPGESWTLRARRAGRVVFRCRLVGGLRAYPRSMPRELRDGHVVEF